MSIFKKAPKLGHFYSSIYFDLVRLCSPQGAQYKLFYIKEPLDKLGALDSLTKKTRNMRVNLGGLPRVSFEFYIKANRVETNE